MTIKTPEIKFDSNDLAFIFSFFEVAWEAQGEQIHRANAESDMAKKHAELWSGVEKHVQIIAQKAFEMGMVYGQAEIRFPEQP